MNYFAHKFFTSLCFENDLEIIDSCILPDEDERKNDYSCHFYNPVTKKCFRGTEDSAKNRFIWHLSNYLIENKNESFERLSLVIECITRSERYVPNRWFSLVSNKNNKCFRW